MFILNIEFKAALRTAVFPESCVLRFYRRPPKIVVKFRDLTPFVAQ